MKVYFCHPENEPAELVEQSQFKEQRTVAGLSPINFELDWNTNYCSVNNKIINPGVKLIDYDDQYIDVREQDILGPKPVIQLKFPMFTFWTYDPDIWIYQYDYPMTALDNNFVAVGAWWNLSNWVRNTNTGIVPVDINNPITIRKDDPLFRISFYHKDMKGDIILEQKDENEIPQDMKDRRESQFKIIDDAPTSLPEKLFCPYDKN
tara:strand:+ start:1328 stop:1945 length:618 start_codon:yes stop_codon:yes gene_type:complete